MTAKGNTMKIYVGNLSYKTTEDTIREQFERFGDVSEVVIITDRETGRPKGFGFVEMPQREEGDAAINALNGTALDERDIVVNEARPQQPRTGGGGGGGNRRFNGGGGGGGGRRY